MNTVTAHRVRISKVRLPNVLWPWQWACKCGVQAGRRAWDSAVQDSIIHLRANGIRT